MHPGGINLIGIKLTRSPIQTEKARRYNDDRKDSRQSRGGLAVKGGSKKVERSPKRTLKLSGSPLKTKILRPSEVRLKVRNLDDKQVTNDDLKVRKL